jgi:hypothetical protein
MGTQQIRGCLDFSRYKSCIVKSSIKNQNKITRLREFFSLQKLRRQNQNKFQHPDHGQANDLGNNFYTLKQKGRQSESTDVRINKLKVKTV